MESSYFNFAEIYSIWQLPLMAQFCNSLLVQIPGFFPNRTAGITETEMRICIRRISAEGLQTVRTSNTVARQLYNEKGELKIKSKKAFSLLLF
ncbi:MAG: hypothetical protein M1117_04175 [Candidatus Thermoplasmatota archaeon]|nr:hypothetical protein [Candidatus Thermoplasmatota archaeon]